MSQETLSCYVRANLCKDWLKWGYLANTWNIDLKISLMWALGGLLYYIISNNFVNEFQINIQWWFSIVIIALKWGLKQGSKSKLTPAKRQTQVNFGFGGKINWGHRPDHQVYIAVLFYVLRWLRLAETNVTLTVHCTHHEVSESNQWFIDLMKTKRKTKRKVTEVGVFARGGVCMMQESRDPG